MPQPPELGAVYWSETAGQFYQEGRSGAVTREEGISHLTSQIVEGELRFYDQRGNETPTPIELLPQSETTRYVNVAREGTMTTREEAYNNPIPGTSYGTMFVWHDPDGHVHVEFEQFRIGSTIDEEVERSRMAARIASVLGLESDSPEGGSDRLLGYIDAIGHFGVV